MLIVEQFPGAPLALMMPFVIAILPLIVFICPVHQRLYLLFVWRGSLSSIEVCQFIHYQATNRRRRQDNLQLKAKAIFFLLLWLFFSL